MGCRPVQVGEWVGLSGSKSLLKKFELIQLDQGRLVEPRWWIKKLDSSYPLDGLMGARPRWLGPCVGHVGLGLAHPSGHL